TNLTEVTAVKFANNITAQFTVNSATQLTATVPAGAVTGPITISKTGCGDVQTASFIVCNPITINPATLNTGTTGLTYNQPLTATGGTGAYSFSVMTGTLPSGLTLTTGGLLSGVPLVTGTFNFTISAVDVNGCGGLRAYSLVIACPTITLSPTTLPNGLVGSAYNQTVTAFPALNAGAYNYSVTAGALPAGLSLNPATGAITGNPTAGGTSNFTVTALSSGPCSGSQAYSIFVQPLCPTVTNINSTGGPTSGIVGATVTITGTNFTGVDSVKFANNVTATFTVVSNTQITTTVPAGAVTGAITIGKQFCSDATSAVYTVLPTPTISFASPPTLIGVGRTAAYTVTISPALPTAITLSLSSSNPDVAAVPLNPSIPAGQTSAQFNVVGGSAGTATITAAVPALYGTASATSALTVAAGFEADVQPRPNGDVNGQVTTADWNQVGRFIAGLDSVALGSEFQRADSAPRGTLGDGLLTARDWVQAGRYAAALDPIVGMGGPTAPTPFAANEEPLAFSGNGSGVAASLVRSETIQNKSLPAGTEAGKDQVVIKLTAQGGENALSFGLIFQASLWRFVSADLTDEASGATLIVNRSESAEGWLGFMFSYPTGKTLSAGEHRLFTVTFEPVANSAEALFTGFSDYPTAREVSDVNANRLPSNFAADYSFAGMAACANVSAASFAADRLAAEQIVAVFGDGLATTTASARTLPLPTTLGGATVKITDSKGVERMAALFFVSPGQINYLLPDGLAEGIARVTITANGKTSVGLIDVAPIAPSLFTANSDGRGLPAAVLLRIHADGSQSYEAVTRFDAAQNRFVAVPIEFGGSSEQLFLLLYGTGLRHPGGRAIKITVGGMEAPTPFAGAVDGFAGLDQINLNLPRSLAGRGEVEIGLTIGDRVANAVKIVVR
ncbi:MAG: putative Ig domain-containing protein, partial [Acidobacteriota bacterium]